MDFPKTLRILKILKVLKILKGGPGLLGLRDPFKNL